MTTHMAVAQAVASGSADVGMGVASAAQVMGLDFIPVGVEEYDFLFRRDALETPSGRAFLSVIQGDSFRRELERLGGYEFDRPGRICEG